MSAHSRFRALAAARAKIELAVLEAMPMVFSDVESDRLVLRPGYEYVAVTFRAIDRATKKAWLAARGRRGKR